jgi:hypothetical protein
LRADIKHEAFGGAGAGKEMDSGAPQSQTLANTQVSCAAGVFGRDLGVGKDLAITYNGTYCTYNYKNSGGWYNMPLVTLEVCAPAYAWISQNKLIQCFDNTGAVSV